MAKTTGIAQFSQGSSDLFKIDPRKLYLKPGWNMRSEGPDLDEHIDELALSIAEVGVKEAITVRLEDGKLWVINGHCRTRATMRAIEHYKANIKTVPVQAEDRYANDADLVLSQVIRNKNKPLKPLEEARIYKKLLDMGWQQGEIGKKVGKTDGRISQILSYLEMPASVQAQVATGAVSASLAQKVVKEADTPAQASAALQEAIEKADGKKVKPADVGKKNAITVLKEAFENSDVDCSEEIIRDEGVINIVMPVEDWEKVRKLLEL